MIIVDRVYCDVCEASMGQLLTGPVQAPGLLADHGKPPYHCVCPDCIEASQAEAPEAA